MAKKLVALCDLPLGPFSRVTCSSSRAGFSGEPYCLPRNSSLQGRNSVDFISQQLRQPQSDLAVSFCCYLWAALEVHSDSLFVEVGTKWRSEEVNAGEAAGGGALWGRLGPWSQPLLEGLRWGNLNLTQPLAGNLWLDSGVMSAEPEPTSSGFNTDLAFKCVENPSALFWPFQHVLHLGLH